MVDNIWYIEKKKKKRRQQQNKTKLTWISMWGDYVINQWENGGYNFLYLVMWRDRHSWYTLTFFEFRYLYDTYELHIKKMVLSNKKWKQNTVWKILTEIDGNSLKFGAHL